MNGCLLTLLFANVQSCTVAKWACSAENDNLCNNEFGTGEFRDPQVEMEQNQGVVFQQFFYYIFDAALPKSFARTSRSNPYSRPQPLPNLVTIFGGHVGLTPDAASIEADGQPGLLVDRDKIQRGRYNLFRGFSNAKTLMWLTIPGLVLVHLVFVVFRVPRKDLLSYFFSSWADLSDWKLEHKSVVARHLKLLLVMLTAGSCGGIDVIWFSAESAHKGLHINDAASDPVTRQLLPRRCCLTAVWTGHTGML
jgi:hypothetical protein